MKITIRIPSRIGQRLALAGLVAFGGAAGWAQQAPLAPTAPIPGTMLDEHTLAGEAELQAPVTFEARRHKLADVLAALQAQSGVALAIAPGSPLAARRLTARARAMPLAQVLASLSRLYGAAWARNGAALEMTANGRSDIENVQWKLNSTFGNSLRAAEADPIDWNKTVAGLNANWLKAGGVTTQDLPAATAQKLRDQMESHDVIRLAISLGKLRPTNLAGGSLSFWEDTPPGRVKLRLFDPDSHLVYDEFVNVPPPDKPDAK